MTTRPGGRQLVPSGVIVFVRKACRRSLDATLVGAELVHDVRERQGVPGRRRADTVLLRDVPSTGSRQPLVVVYVHRRPSGRPRRQTSPRGATRSREPCMKFRTFDAISSSRNSGTRRRYAAHAPRGRCDTAHTARRELTFSTAAIQRRLRGRARPRSGRELMTHRRLRSGRSASRSRLPWPSARRRRADATIKIGSIAISPAERQIGLETARGAQFMVDTSKRGGVSDRARARVDDDATTQLAVQSAAQLISRRRSSRSQGDQLRRRYSIRAAGAGEDLRR